MMGSILLGSKDNSDENSFKTPPETVDKESETEHDDNLNPPEISEDELGNDSEVEKLLNNPENDTAMDLHKFYNYPDILDLKTGQNTLDSDKDESDMRDYPPSHSRHGVPMPHSLTGILGSSWRYTLQDPHPPLRVVR